MLLKSGVCIRRLSREMRRALPSIARVYKNIGMELVITETFGGVHSPGSLHYADDAVDARLPPAEHIAEVVLELKKRLGAAFDVVRESSHIHIEYDPKG